MPLPNSLVVRDAAPADASLVAEFNALLARETEDKSLDLDVLRRGVASALADPTSRLRYWIAELHGEPVGQAAVSYEWSDWRNGWLWWLQSVYIRHDARGKGVFRAIHRHIRNTALKLPDVVGLRLYVERDNHAAQGTYRSLGFTAGGYHVMQELWLPPKPRPLPAD
jgi:GNAT superfamily N-acetyltransferase